MRKPKLRELAEAVRAFIHGPYTLGFPKEPAPLAEEFRGAPRYHEEDCVGCAACFEVCPANAIHKVDDVTATPPVRRLTIHHDECIFCGQCELYCTTEKGVTQTHDYDLATFDRAEVRETVEKELVLCEVCGEVVVRPRGQRVTPSQGRGVGPGRPHARALSQMPTGNPGPGPLGVAALPHGPTAANVSPPWPPLVVGV